MTDFTITIRGRRWSVRFAKRLPPDRIGDCDTERRVIRIRRGLSDAETVGVLLHELLHALYPHHTEEDVLEAELVLTRALHKAGLCRGEE